VADAVAAPEGGPELDQLPPKGIALHLDAHQLPGYASSTDPLQRVLPDVVALLVLNEPLQAGDFEWVVGERHVGAIVEDARLDAAGLARGDRTDVVGSTGLHDPFPEVVAPIRVSEIDLVPDLPGPPRSPDHHRDAVQR
jgi:hypothetical protein